MPRRRTVFRVLLGVYLIAGLAYATGCRDAGLARAWVARRLAAMEELEPLQVERVERLTVSAGEDRLDLALELVDPQGLHYEFSVSDPVGSPFDTWSRVVLHVGFTHFLVDTEVFTVEADGTVASTTEPLSADDRADALLVLVNEGRENHWFAFAYPPPVGGREVGVALANMPMARFALPRPITDASRRKRAAASVALVPLAFAIDVLTWPVQGVMWIVTVTSIRVH